MRVGLYPGTFDPVTVGHLDIIRRSSFLVNKLVIGVAVNDDKTPLFSLEERKKMIGSACEGIIKQTGLEILVHPFENLLIHCARDVGATLIIRGLRAVSDFEYEYQMVGMNRVMDDGVETVFIMAEAEHQAVSSKLVKEIARLGGNVTSFVSLAVESALKDKLK
jgi:pantetheine-phosphate adenylyltransferase